MAFPSVVGGAVWWEEGRPEEARTTLMRRDADGTVTDLLSAGLEPEEVVAVLPHLPLAPGAAEEVTRLVSEGPGQPS